QCRVAPTGWSGQVRSSHPSFVRRCRCALGRNAARSGHRMRADHTLSPALVGLDTEHWSVRVCEALRSIGLNAVGVVDGREHAELLPRCRSIIIFASGGSALWDAFVEDL